MATTNGTVYVTRRIPQPGIDALAGLTVKTWDSDEAIPHNELVKNVKGVDALLCMLTDTIDKEVLDAAGPQLMMIASMSVGYEHIDIAECKLRGIHVTNTPGVSTDSVAEFTVTLLLCATRRLLEGVAAVKNDEWGLWKPMWILGNELHQSTVGVVGFGRIGFGVAQRLQAFGVKQILYEDIVKSPFACKLNAQFVTFDEICSRSDFICVCCDLTPSTHHLFNAAAFNKMKRNVIIVNSGRGGVINHDDLYDALKAGNIRGAALDVTEPEPLPHDHKLLSLANCIISPHMGSNTWESRNDMAIIAGGNVARYFKGDKLIGDVTEEKKPKSSLAAISECMGDNYKVIIPCVVVAVGIGLVVRLKMVKS